MSIFNQKSKFKVKTEVRTVRQVVESKPKPKPQSSSVAARTSSVSNGAKAKRNGLLSVGTPRASPRPGSLRGSPLPAEHSASANRKRRAGSSRSPASPNFSESGDEDDNWEESLDARKRMKRAHEALPLADPNRVLRHPKLWTGSSSEDGADVVRLPIIHAASFASLEQKCQPVLGLAPDQVGVKLQYPGARHPERYVGIEQQRRRARVEG